MNQQTTEYKLLALDLEIRKKDDPAHIHQCGAILHELHSNTEIAKLNTKDFGHVLPKRLHKGKFGSVIKPAKSITQEDLFQKILPLIEQADLLICHKVIWDTENLKKLFLEFASPDQIALLEALPAFCTLFDLAKIIGVLDDRGKAERWLRLENTYDKYFPGETFEPHDAYEDAKACLRIFLKAYELKEIQFG
jgi:hypothetical protein